MKNKLINFRISDDFDVFLESMWRTSKYRELGIKSKSDLFRYAVLNTIGRDYGFDILNKFKNVDEIHRYLNPKKGDSKKHLNQLKNDIEEYFQKRKSGEISFTKVDSQEKEMIDKYFGSLSKTDKSNEISGADELPKNQ